MAAGALARPGTEFGPCIEPCEHEDCKQIRLMAKMHCEVRGEPIGYERRYYLRGDPSSPDTTRLVHAVCVE